MFKVSHSKIQTWRRCHRAYHYAYNEELEKKVKPRPLVFGTIVHEMIEAKAKGKSPWTVLRHYNREQGKMFREEVDEYGDIIADITWIMTEFFDTYKNDPLEFVEIDGHKAEIPFELEIDKEIILRGYIDAYVRNKKDRTQWVMDHKAVKSIPDATEEWKFQQTLLYHYVVEKLGMGEPDGIIYDYISSKSPTYPNFTKSGELSRRDSLVTLPSTFRDFLDDNDLPHKDYKDVLARLKERRHDFFIRKYVPVNLDVRRHVVSDCITTANEILERGEIDSAMNIDRHCSWCNYRLICSTRMTGGDTDFVKERYYVKKENDQKKTTRKTTRNKSAKRKTSSRQRTTYKRRNLR